MASKGQNNLTNSCSMAKYCQWMFLLSWCSLCVGWLKCPYFRHLFWLKRGSISLLFIIWRQPLDTDTNSYLCSIWKVSWWHVWGPVAWGAMRQKKRILVLLITKLIY
jgi:hypothetical protein